MLCCFCNSIARAYDDIEYFDPPVFCNDNIYEDKQIQNVCDSDGHEEEILLCEEISECDSSESRPASGCGETSSEASVSAMDALSNDVVDGCEEVSARHARSDMVIVESATDEILLSAGESTVNDDESEYQSDNFSEAGRIDMKTITPEAAGVRGPQSESVLFPQDCKKLIQVCRGILRLQQCDDEVKSFQIESLREEAIHFIHEDVFNKVILCFQTFLNCIAYCNSRV